MIKTKEELLKIIADQVGINVEIKENDSLVEDLGLDELDLVELTMMLEDEFSIEIMDEEAEKFITINNIINYLQSKNITLN
jgi:acyl carrier protein